MSMSRLHVIFILGQKNTPRVGFVSTDSEREQEHTGMEWWPSMGLHGWILLMCGLGFSSSSFGGYLREDTLGIRASLAIWIN